MSASERAAWGRLAICATAIVVVAWLIPWLGHRAASGFALLALGAATGLFVRRRGGRVVVDERDRTIDRRATSVAVGTAWLTLVTLLAVGVIWSSLSDVHAIPLHYLNWLIWSQFFLCIVVKSAAALVLYRGRCDAA